jgi:hypothetical protein
MSSISKSNTRLFAAIAWLLTGLILSNALLDSLPLWDESVTIVEGRECVTDDDRSDSVEFEIGLIHHADEFIASAVSFSVVDFHADHFYESKQAAHRLRGPPLTEVVSSGS